MPDNAPHNALRHHVTGAIERGEGGAIVEIPALTIGQRVELHPATDAWMMGDRYGEVVKIGRTYIHVKMDRSGKVRKVRADLLTVV